MTQSPRPDPAFTGGVVKPSFARLPDPAAIFKERAQRFRTLASDHDLKPYLLFLADLCEVQHDIQSGLPAAALPAADALARAREFAMPPLDRNRFMADAACDATLDGLCGCIARCELTPAAHAALQSVRSADAATLAAMMQSVLSDAIPVESLAEHVFIAAALQVHFARLAAQLDAKELVAVGDGVCPACGGPPASSMVVEWQGAGGARFCACTLCGTQWNYIRAKCCCCGSTKDVTYQEIEGGPGTIKAECCGECRTYVKVLHHQQDVLLDPIADDVASLRLDLLVRETGLRRGGVNPFLIGY